MIHQTRLSFAKVKNEIPEFKNPSNFPSFLLDRSSIRACHLKDRTKCDTRTAVSHYHKKRPLIHCPPVHCTANGGPQELSDEDEVCPVECVREIKKDKKLLAILEKAKKANSLVVVDFYRTSCGSCKYIEHGFAKLCKGSADEEAAVIFLKHNVIDEYDDQSDIAERLRIKITIWTSSVSFQAFADISFESTCDAGKGITDLKSSLENIFADKSVIMLSIPNANLSTILSNMNVSRNGSSNEESSRNAEHEERVDKN